MLESAKDNESLKRLCAEQDKIIKKLEVERDDAQGNETMHLFTIRDMTNHTRELEEKLSGEPIADPAETSVQHLSPNLEYAGKSLVVFTEPSVSLGLTQMEMDDVKVS